ncbi:MAG: amino acid ABC transporter permease [Rhodospirillaceae bacterium]|nr:amino acid ABC transporter permease [Rhodospirillaceae bacterium]MDE0255029.1 amino acid ABC transporter permease [Rhodospirillaceae bacterium]MDE0617608.1 amino acid ABC transporter permease [Rhodospirillaceae bacterium]
MDFLGVISNHYNAFLAGAVMTAVVSAVCIAAGMILGLWLSFGLISQNRPIRRASAAYRSFWRGTPILVQLLIVFYLLPTIGVDVPPIAAAIIALTMNTAAFQAEIFRGGLLSIPSGQVEAARMLGIGILSIRIRILIPQMMRLVLPALINETISILKNSSLISVIAVTELMRTSQQVVSVTYRPLETYMIAAVIYLAMNLVLARAGSWFEKRHAVAAAH